MVTMLFVFQDLRRISMPVLKTRQPFFLFSPLTQERDKRDGITSSHIIDARLWPYLAMFTGVFLGAFSLFFGFKRKLNSRHLLCCRLCLRV